MNHRQRIKAIAKFYGRPTERDGSAKIRCPAHEGLSYSLSLRPEPGPQDRVSVRCYGRRCHPGEVEWRLYVQTGIRANPRKPGPDALNQFLNHALDRGRQPKQEPE